MVVFLRQLLSCSVCLPLPFRDVPVPSLLPLSTSRCAITYLNWVRTHAQLLSEIQSAPTRLAVVGGLPEMGSLCTWSLNLSASLIPCDQSSAQLMK